ncbi:DUF262 domain-containing protein [Vibrio vulnificus]|uniref:DUF262 domain-containing protein n=1 Tax=Vibrio vulnificus TaxID=672 RepID=UPI00102A1719|nr:DUF262 domain-containing protein [Vibrio vulnificus]EGQ7992256.1 DUF262 domain-containing protein [Vibrio vulnificus]MCU8122233.1 DUF262 domain-containing protein [Vibrio vulnificus]MCU8546633.1 DUF262 domain-containing protein [Vibrio vulnificus]MCU8575909.1 DUF262 domain-containing protein [Vibrio vulnificus]RZP76312.1 DUF262 domain-containing protein [Vibrio vulnificus]
MNSNSQVYISQQQVEDIFKRHLKTSEYSLSIRTLFGPRMSRKINYHPYYQRNYVWDNAKASFFIESILLGTDIPPIILFNTGDTIEVIDGRQRYETIKRFRENELKLSIKGLNKLTQFKGQTFSKLDPDIIKILDNTKIRIFEFEVINEPRLSSSLEDKIKKEIFRRYNSGITPLNAAEIDNAVYDDDPITIYFKDVFSKDDTHLNIIKDTFIGHKGDNGTAKALEFLRKYLVLSSFPIKTYANGTNRTEIIDLLYNVRSDNIDDIEDACQNMFDNLSISSQIISEIPSGELNFNRYVSECILWAVGILKDEGKEHSYIIDRVKVNKIVDRIVNNSSIFIEGNAHYYKSIIDRFSFVANIFQEIFEVNFSKYIKDEDFKDKVKGMRQSEREAKLKLEELSSFRLHRPDASMLPVEEIIHDLNNHSYMLRPSYQRQEKINQIKASAIIESIMLGIKLPPIFVYINEESVKEIIDGQQRLLSILGFTGNPYIDENGKTSYPKLNNFKLQRLKILSEYNGKRFIDLPHSIQDKILEFRLGVIEIESSFNKAFDPVDLFVRLNNKPYPIQENSFEMWNSFVEKDAIKRIKEVTKQNVDWFYVKNPDSRSSADRMQNEELITMLAYIAYNNKHRPTYKSVGYFLRAGRINCRIGDKKDISSLLEKISTDIELRNKFIGFIDETADKINKLKKLLLDNPNDITDHVDLKSSLNDLFNFGKIRTNNIRTLADFFILFEILHSVEKSGVVLTDIQHLKDRMSHIQTLLLSPPDLGDSSEDYYGYFKSEFSHPL